MEIESLHLGTLLITAVAILYADHLAYAYLKGKRELLDQVMTKRLHMIVWCGLIGMIISGTLLFIPMAEYLLTEPVFYLKMTFVLVLVVNALVIGKISHVASERPFAMLLPKEQRTLMLSGAVSLFSWAGAALIGLFFL